jgi:hypothetical protein
MNDTSTASIKLSIYEWHTLLNELEYLQRICNRDISVPIYLLEQISTQLNGKEVCVYGSDKHRKLHPEDFKETTKTEEPKPIIKKSLLDRILGK